MHYRFGKTRALNRTERWRLRTAIRLQHALRHEQMPGEDEGPERLRQLHAALVEPDGTANTAAIDWLLCHAPPPLLRRFIVRVQRRAFRQGMLSLVARMRPDALLQREHITPDWQILHGDSAPASALLALTGHAMRLNIPLQLFHSLVARHFDAFVYLRDSERLHFRSGVVGLGASVAEVTARLADELQSCSHVALLATSSGANATLEMAAALGARRIALFSPDLIHDVPAQLVEDIERRGGEIRAHFARQSRQDRELAKAWQVAVPRVPPRWLHASNHGTLSHFVHAGEFPQLRHWLTGGEDP